MSPISDPIYCPENVPLFEAIYGKNLISLGGLAAVDRMLSGLNVRGLKILDLGFGLGGAAFYLAQTYQVEVTGVEIHPWMVAYAKEQTPPNLSHLLKFDTYNDRGEIPFSANSFDMVYSKGVLNHVKDKNTLFQQVALVLKPQGLFVIADWLFPQIKTDTTGFLACETQESYQQVLEDTGFSEVTFRNDSKIFLAYVKTLLKHLIEQQKFIEQKYGEEIFSTVLKKHQELAEEINHESKFATRIIAKNILKN